MSVDIFQEKIRKSKNPSVLELGVTASELPTHILEEEQNITRAYIRFCQELLEGLKGLVPAVRISFSAFAFLEENGLNALTQILKFASEQGYYVILDAPEILSPASAAMTADVVLGKNSRFPCDALVISGYMGSDIIKPFIPYCKDNKKDIYVVARTANKSAAELQDLLSGSRVVHAAAADQVNRFGADTTGKFGYTRIGILAAASAADSLRSLRMKYPKLFILLDGYDYPNSNAKNCSYAFDKYGHGAAACSGRGIACAWKNTDSDGRDYVQQACAAAERMKKNLTRYVTIL